MMIALVAIGLLVVRLYPSIWDALSREQVATFIGIGVALTVIIVLLATGGASLGWTGFGEKKLWDWLQLLSALAIPIVLAAAGLWFTAQQEEHQRFIEEQRAKSEQKIEKQRADDAALQAYLEQMSNLLVEKDLRTSKPFGKLRTLARAQTLSTLETLDAAHRRTLLLFLYEAHLLNKPSSDASPEEVTSGKDPVIILAGANLQAVDLSYVDLSNLGLFPAAIPDPQAHEMGNYCVGDCIGIDLSGVNLSHADLRGTLLARVSLLQTSLYHANLRNANLVDAFCRNADLRNADLSGANLGGADLTGANLKNVVGMSGEELEQQVDSLSGATMPNGQKHEEWLKDKKNRGKNE